MTEQKKKQSCKYITKKMATDMAEDIRVYWAEQGHTIEVWVERMAHGNAFDYTIRSNMQNGLPN